MRTLSLHDQESVLGDNVRKKVYDSSEVLQSDLDECVACYNTKRVAHHRTCLANQGTQNAQFRSHHALAFAFHCLVSNVLILTLELVPLSLGKPKAITTTSYPFADKDWGSFRTLLSFMKLFKITLHTLGAKPLLFVVFTCLLSD